MKYEDARKLEVGDKIVVEIGEIRWKDHLEEVRVFPVSHADVNYSVINNEEILGKLSDFQQQEKIKFTKAEKDEFDKLKKSFQLLRYAFNSIEESQWYPNLKKALIHDYSAEQKIVTAWYYPELMKLAPILQYHSNMV